MTFKVPQQILDHQSSNLLTHSKVTLRCIFFQQIKFYFRIGKKGEVFKVFEYT